MALFAAAIVALTLSTSGCLDPIPDGTINITDIVLILEAFTGSGYPWEEPCQ